MQSQPELESSQEKYEGFNPTVVSFNQPEHHFCYLLDADGDWLSTNTGTELHVQGHVDDAAIWDIRNGQFIHETTGMALQSDAADVGEQCKLVYDGRGVSADGSLGESACFSVAHGPEHLPSDYLSFLNENGWVCLTCIMPPAVVDGLQRVGCVDSYADRKPVRATPLAQDPAVAQVTAEPISLWLTREYMQTHDIRLGHSPGVSALTRDDGEREVQGWHTDFPYLWGTGDRVPVPSGDLVLGMQRNVCVSDFNRENGATLFKLGSHATMKPPPQTWGISTDTYRRGHRAKFGLPYAGPDADLVEAPAGSIVLYDARTWHRAGMNFTDQRRGAMIQAITPGFIVPFMDTSATFKAFLTSSAFGELSAREQKEMDKLMVHKIMGPAGMFAITVDEDLTARAREQRAVAASIY